MSGYIIGHRQLAQSPAPLFLWRLGDRAGCSRLLIRAGSSWCSAPTLHLWVAPILKPSSPPSHLIRTQRLISPFFRNSMGFQSSVGFPDSSVGKESTCSAGDPGSIPGSGRSAGEGVGYPFQYCWASLVAQLVKNPPAVREAWVQSLGWEDPLEKGKAAHSSILVWRVPWSV